MSIDPVLLGGQQPFDIPAQFTSEGAYGDYLNQMRAANARTPRQAPQAPQPFYRTQTDMEIINPGETAESIITRQERADAEERARKAAAEEEARKKNAGTTTTPGAGSTTTGSGTTAPIVSPMSEQQVARQSAYDLLYQQFAAYGLGALVEPLRGLVQDNISPSEFTIRLRDTDAYKKRFAANAQRTTSGLRALNEAEYIGLEDAYQNVMRRYGLPESYYTAGELGRQSNFEKFIAGDISPAELEDRVQTAQSRVINANPEVAQALRTYYPGITNGDILAYALDTKQAIKDIQRKITAAEIGGAALQAGLGTDLAQAENLAKYGITKEAAQKGFQTIADILPRGSQLASIYKESPYTQQTAEQEVFGLTGSTEAERQRKKLTQLETAAFSGQTGMGALARDRAGAF